MPIIKRNDEPRRKHVRRVSDSASADGDILEKISNIATDLKIHLAEETKRNEVVDIIYKLFVTGNGTPSFQEKVRTLEASAKTNKYFVLIIILSFLGYALSRFWLILFP